MDGFNFHFGFSSFSQLFKTFMTIPCPLVMMISVIIFMFYKCFSLTVWCFYFSCQKQYHALLEKNVFYLLMKKRSGMGNLFVSLSPIEFCSFFSSVKLLVRDSIQIICMFLMGSPFKPSHIFFFFCTPELSFTLLVSSLSSCR